MKRKTYTARCQRSGEWWAISVPELRGVHTQARRLEKAEAMARDAIALFLDVPSDAFDVRIEPVLPRDLQGKVGRARKARGACWGSPINGSPSCSRQLQGKASAPTGLAFAPLAPADPRAIAALDHAGTRLDDLHSVVLHGGFRCGACCKWPITLGRAGHPAAAIGRWRRGADARIKACRNQRTRRAISRCW